MRIKAHFLYIFLAIGISILALYFFLGSTSVFMIDKKLGELQNIEGRSIELRTEVDQMEKHLNRLKTDSEYVIASAKSYGYLGSKEKIVRIISSDNNKAYSFYTEDRDNSTLVANNGDGRNNIRNHVGHSLSGILPILLISIGSISVYLLVKYQINIRKRLKA